MKAGIRIMVAAGVAGLMAVGGTAVTPALAATSMQVQYVGHHGQAIRPPGGAVPPPHADTPAGAVDTDGIFTVTPSGSSISLYIDDTASPFGFWGVAVSVIQGDTRRFGCVTVRRTAELTGLTEGEPVTVILWSPAQSYGAPPVGPGHQGCRLGVGATTGTVTVTF